MATIVDEYPNPWGTYRYPASRIDIEDLTQDQADQLVAFLTEVLRREATMVFFASGTDPWPLYIWSNNQTPSNLRSEGIYGRHSRSAFRRWAKKVHPKALKRTQEFLDALPPPPP